MSATAIIVIKIMPDSPQAPLKDIKASVQSFIEKNGGKGTTLEEQEVAFGLKAIILKSAVPEEKGSDFFESGITQIAHVSSVTIEDYRRAFG